MTEIIIIIGVFIVACIYINSQIENLIDRKNNNLEKNLKEYEQKEKAGKQKSKVQKRKRQPRKSRSKKSSHV
tara:strand:- start:1227 stop:1442 length:216 start_codon:yes stop_codon:yes gene_type:complete